MGQRSGRTDEPDDQGGDRQALPLDSHEQLRARLADFIAAYNFVRPLTPLSGLTPYEYICKIWTSEPDLFILNPIHQMPGLNTYEMSPNPIEFRYPN